MLEKISSKKYKKNWAGNFGMPLASSLAYHYSEILKKDFGVGLPYFVIVIEKGYGTCYFEIESFHAFGENIAHGVRNGELDIEEMSLRLKKEADVVFSLTEEARMGNFSQELFVKYVETLYSYSSAHRFVKNIVDYLSPQELERYFKILEDARLYSEPAYTFLEEFTQLQSKYISAETKLAYEQVHALSRDEILTYWESRILPGTETLTTRFNKAAIVSLDSEIEIVIKNVSDIEDALTHVEIQKEFSGTIAYKGVVQGTVRVILDPNKEYFFNQGDILVADMTRPEYIPIIQKSSAIVTDAGGMLCHAAISAREFKIPCVVGTEVATKSLKDGDLVEVDADKGIIKILNK
jgi:phosphohistidine swiveling domain-containing protein